MCTVSVCHLLELILVKRPPLPVSCTLSLWAWCIPSDWCLVGLFSLLSVGVLQHIFYTVKMTFWSITHGSTFLFPINLFQNNTRFQSLSLSKARQFLSKLKLSFFLILKYAFPAQFWKFVRRSLFVLVYIFASYKITD